MTEDSRPILFLGDIQGCPEELAELLKQAAFDSRIHRLIPLGDTINRGPDAAGVISLLRQHRAEQIGVGALQVASVRVRETCGALAGARDAVRHAHLATRQGQDEHVIPKTNTSVRPRVSP